jgi:glycosyltransferase involved in cell wall biosynthesis
MSGARRHRLLFVSSRCLFPVDSGGKIRTTNILRGMKGGAFEITLASPLPPDSAARQPDETADVCDRFVGWSDEPRGRHFQWTRLRHLASHLPVAVATDASETGRAAIARDIEEGADLVVVDFPHAGVLASPPFPCPSVIFTHNVETEIYERHAKRARNPVKRAIWRNQAAKMERFERELLPRFTTVVAVADRDRDFFERRYGVEAVSVIPTGVDFEYFSYHGITEAEEKDGGTVVFTGAMDWMANIDGVEFLMDEVWPAVVRARPRARCVIVGRNPPASLIERAGARGLSWQFTGFVDDVRPWVRDAHVYAIPLRVGGGTRIKVYEAMAMGCPVVSTRIGVEGLPVAPGRHFVEADTAAAMAESIIGLLGDHALRARLSREARDYVEQNMSARVAARAFEEICLRALDGRPR